jgi:hypothetical protein
MGAEEAGGELEVEEAGGRRGGGGGDGRWRASGLHCCISATGLEADGAVLVDPKVGDREGAWRWRTTMMQARGAGRRRRWRRRMASLDPRGATQVCGRPQGAQLAVDPPTSQRGPVHLDSCSTLYINNFGKKIYKQKRVKICIAK